MTEACLSAMASCKCPWLERKKIHTRACVGSIHSRAIVQLGVLVNTIKKRCDNKEGYCTFGADGDALRKSLLQENPQLSRKPTAFRSRQDKQEHCQLGSHKAASEGSRKAASEAEAGNNLSEKYISKTYDVIFRYQISTMVAVMYIVGK